ncbi:MAG: sulfatase-like hydrolase/transferase, partial [Planctomycetota bacterium]
MSTTDSRRRVCSLRLLTALFFVLQLAVSANSIAADRPNIVLVFIDDMGWADFSCFGNKEVQTENIDRLASEGIRFQQFYVNSPICSPSRVAISTGQYPQRWRITSYLNNRKSNIARGMAQWLDPTAPMLARFLHDAGYATGHFGKWHMGGQRDVADAPLITEYGFDESLTNFEGLGPRVLAMKDAYDGQPPKPHELGSHNLGRGKITYEDRSLVTQSFTTAALNFVKAAEKSGKPFYVNLWPDDVHSPFFPPKARRGDGTKRTLYHGVLDTADEQIGVLLNYIRENPKLRDNTLILICSDNGPEQGAGSA